MDGRAGKLESERERMKSSLWVGRQDMLNFCSLPDDTGREAIEEVVLL